MDDAWSLNQKLNYILRAADTGRPIFDPMVLWERWRMHGHCILFWSCGIYWHRIVVPTVLLCCGHAGSFIQDHICMHNMCHGSYGIELVGLALSPILYYVVISVTNCLYYLSDDLQVMWLSIYAWLSMHVLYACRTSFSFSLYGDCVDVWFWFWHMVNVGT